MICEWRVEGAEEEVKLRSLTYVLIPALYYPLHQLFPETPDRIQQNKHPNQDQSTHLWVQILDSQTFQKNHPNDLNKISPRNNIRDQLQHFGHICHWKDETGQQNIRNQKENCT